MLSTTLLMKLWQKLGLTEEFVEEHPVLGAVRFTIRVIVTIGSAVVLVYAPIHLFLLKVIEFAVRHFPDEKEEEKE